MIAVLAVVLTIIVIIAVLTRLYEKSTNALCKCTKQLDGKTVLITGGTAGMGLEMAQDLARRRAKIIIASPFVLEGNQARETIIKSTDNQNVVYEYLDLATFKSVREFAKKILEKEERLDILINNAGVLMPPDVKTVDGLGLVMQVNYFGLFLLTLLLLPLLKKSSTDFEHSRIVNISSVLHNAGTVDMEKINRVKYWYKWRIYCNSKLCVAMFTRELSKRLAGSNIVVNSVDPGAVGTRIYDSCGLLIGFLVRILFGAIFKTPWEGAQTALHVALDDKTGAISGEFFKNCKMSRANRAVYNNKKCAELFEESIKFVKLDNVATLI